MTLSYQTDSGGRATVEAELTTAHPCSHYGQPVLVLEDGEPLDLLSWMLCDWRIEEATDKERTEYLDWQHLQVTLAGWGEAE